MSADFSRQTTALKDAVEDAQGGNKYFLKSFSKSQKAGLKELTKKLEKADSEVAKQKKVLDQQLGAKSDSGTIAGTADKLEKALAEFQTQQIEFRQRDGNSSSGDVRLGFVFVWSRATRSPAILALLNDTSARSLLAAAAVAPALHM